MSVVPCSPRLDTSAASSLGTYADSGQVKHYVKELLKSRIFLGRYIERRLVDEKIGYRDVVVLSAAEVELKRDLLDAQQRLQCADPAFHWIGISEADSLGYTTSGVYLWTLIDNEPFGAFWFQIKTVKFREDEVVILLKPLRHLSEAYLELEPILTKGTKKVKAVESNSEMIVDTSSVTLAEAYQNIITTLKTVLTVSNVKEFITFVLALIIAIFTGSTAFINFLGNFVLALIREFSILIKNSTPMFLGFLDFIGKIVGGFYILIAMFFKPNTQSPFDKRRIRSPVPQPVRNSYYHSDNIHVD